MPAQPVSAVYRFIFAAIISVVLLIVDHRTDSFQGVRSMTTVVVQPIYRLLDVPFHVRRFFTEYWPNRKLIEHYEQARATNLNVQAAAQQIDALRAENERLLKLLSASRVHRSEGAMLAEVLDVNVDEFEDRVIINRGEESGVYLGEAVVDATGLLGQVSEVGVGSSQVTLLTDATHAAPVENLRTGMHSLARGEGGSQPLTLPYLSAQTDVEVGDMLVTSGLGGVFPRDHPVAVVSEVEVLPGEAFLRVRAKPLAKIDQARYVMLVRWQSKPLEMPDPEPDPAEPSEPTGNATAETPGHPAGSTPTEPVVQE